MGNRYEYVVLDMDGTLYSHRKYMKACSYAGKRLLDCTKEEGIPKAFIYGIMKDIGNGKVTGAVCRICRRYRRQRMRFLNRVYDMNPERFGIGRDVRLAKEISKLGRSSKVVIFTNTPNIWAKRVISNLGIKGMINPSMIITLEKLDNARYFKPSKRAFDMLVKALHTKPSRIIFLDDSKENVEEARKLGMSAVQICNDKICHLDGHELSRTIYEELGALANSDK
jgi:FMN phosphatase YigB (HAD superfamily)